MRIHGSSLNNVALRIHRQNADRDNSARDKLEKPLNTGIPSKPSSFNSQSSEQIERTLKNESYPRPISPINKQTIENLSIRSQNAINAYTHTSLQPLAEDQLQMIGGIDFYV